MAIEKMHGVPFHRGFESTENALKFKKSTQKKILLMILIIGFPCIKSHYKETFEYDAVLFLCNDLFYTTITNQLV